jgi:DNA-binding transcriptional MocR family regulator
MTIWQDKLTTGNLPIYKKLADAIDLAISEGELKADEKLPPQRQLADALNVTVGTITRAYSEAERRGSVVARVGSGTFVKTKSSSQYLGSDKDVNDSRYYDLQSAKAPIGMQAEMLKEALVEISDDQQLLNECLSYQPESALKYQRQALTSWLNERQLRCNEKNVLFTHGGQHGISLALQSLCRAGDTVLCEGLSFPGISAACQVQQLKCIGLQMDDMGIIPASLEATCAQSHPRVLYVTAQMQNPTSVQMPLLRKQEIVTLCEKHNIVILEDDVQFLPQKDKVTSFYQLSAENTFYISSFSKSFSGGLRIGYVIANDKYIEQIKVALRASCWTMPSLMIEVVCRWLSNGKMEQIEQWLTNEMAIRNHIFQNIFGDYDYTLQPHGFNVWLTLPEPWRAVDFVDYAKNKGVLIRAAESYAIGRFPAPQNIRICICAPKSQEQLEKALLLLKQCLAETPQADDLIM